MAITSKRENILENIRGTALELINGSGNYNLQLRHISRRFRLPQELKNSEFPAVLIRDDLSVNYVRLTNTEYTTGANTQDVHNGMMVALIGYVKLSSKDIGDTGKLSKELNKLHSDLILAMHSDITRGGYALSTTLVRSESALQWASQGFGVLVQVYSIKYDFEPNAGTPVT